MEHNEKKLDSKVIYEGKILTLKVDTVELENFKTSTREVVEHGGGVAVLAVDENNNAIMVRQFRYPYGEVLLEIPAGKLEKGEAPEVCGMRELEEETGYTAESLIPLAKVYPTPGYVTEVLHLYLAKGLVFKKQNLDEDEFLTVEKIPVEKVLKMCMSGEIKDAKTLVSIMKYALSKRT